MCIISAFWRPVRRPTTFTRNGILHIHALRRELRSRKMEYFFVQPTRRRGSSDVDCRFVSTGLAPFIVCLLVCRGVRFQCLISPTAEGEGLHVHTAVFNPNFPARALGHSQYPPDSLTSSGLHLTSTDGSEGGISRVRHQLHPRAMGTHECYRMSAAAENGVENPVQRRLTTKRTSVFLGHIFVGEVTMVVKFF